MPSGILQLSWECDRTVHAAEKEVPARPDRAVLLKLATTRFVASSGPKLVPVTTIESPLVARDPAPSLKL